MEQQQQSKGNSLNLTEVRDIMRNFVKQRDWDQFHTPRNLILALTGEVGQLAEIYQWKGETKLNMEGLTDREKQHTREQVSDILAYLIRFCDVSGIDLGEAFLNKMQKNAKKYPKEMVKGNSAKYTQYKHPQGSS